MKGYKELTDNEIKRLHRKLLGVPFMLPEDLAVLVDRSHESDSLSPNIETRYRRGFKDDVLITWWIENGDIQFSKLNERQEEYDGGSSYNPFKFVKWCQELQLTY